MARTSTVAPEATADMKTKTLVTAIAAALSVTITLAACGGSTSGAPRGAAQDSVTTTVSSTIIAPRGSAQDSATITVSSTTVAPRLRPGPNHDHGLVDNRRTTHHPRRRTRSGARRPTSPAL